ncbi:MAG: hypothetical protein HPY52_09790 [Firmicutes bacterium]|nr:hypothetical protein [Bacillota bacterium]
MDTAREIQKADSRSARWIAADSPTMKYLGHASVRIRTAQNTVIYIDPFAGDDYGGPADLILVTHDHGDHNRVDKVAKKPGLVATTKLQA